MIMFGIFLLQDFMWWSSWWQLCWEGVTQIFDCDWMCYSTAQPFYSKEKSISRGDHREVRRLSHVVFLNAVYDSLSQEYGLSRSSKAAAASSFFRALLTPRPCETVFNHKYKLLEVFCWHQLGCVNTMYIHYTLKFRRSRVHLSLAFSPSLWSFFFIIFIIHII